MNRSPFLLLLCGLFLLAGVARADTVTTSYTGTLQNPDNDAGTFDATDSFILNFSLGSVSDVTLQTFGFGGGTNAAGTVVGPGGTAPFVGLFSGIGDSAAFIDGTSLGLSNYTAGCPPANTVSNFGDTACGDVTLTFAGLAAGDYTVLLTDGLYVPCAANSVGCATGTLADGVGADFTAGYFCNLADVDTGTNCPNVSGDWALDVSVTSASSASPTPEPDSLLLLGSAVVAMAGFSKYRWRRPSA
jgi:hypothetical protein